MDEWLRTVSVWGSSARSIDEVNKSIDFYFKLNTLEITIFDIKFQNISPYICFK